MLFGPLPVSSAALAVAHLPTPAPKNEQSMNKAAGFHSGESWIFAPLNTVLTPEPVEITQV